MHPSGLAVTSCRAANSQVQTFPVYWQKTTLKNLDGVRRVENLGMGKPAFTVLRQKKMKI